MSLITRCPACSTSFKVVLDQLRISEGWVRCGQCTEVFDAEAHLVQVDGQTPSIPRPAPSVAAPKVPPAFLRDRETPPPASPPARATATPQSAAVEPGQTLRRSTPDASPAVKLLNRSEEVLADQLAKLDLDVSVQAVAKSGATPSPRSDAPVAAAKPPPAKALEPLAPPVGIPDLVLPSLPSQAVELPAPPPPEMDEVAALARKLDLPPVPPERVEPTWDTVPMGLEILGAGDGDLSPLPPLPTPLERTEPTAPDVARPTPAGAPASPGPAVTADPDWASHWSAEQQKRVDAEDTATVRSTPLEAKATEEPSGLSDFVFLQQARRRAFWRKPWVRALMLVWVVVLALGLFGQMLWAERNRIAAIFPQAKPFLAGLCSPLGCEIAPLKRLEAVQIESSAFNKGRGDAYLFAVSVKNVATVPVAMPAAELTLTDAQDQAVLRRVISVREMGAPVQLSPGQEWSVSLPVQLVGGTSLRIAGYRVLVFYP